ncbi:MAG: pyruvate ferredoxin oxidoreductase [Candidatus Brocadiaceae bacterium]|nr:pyruvate ferredoxin oxidoreductase [Candidatus Brocadiaceae bacterium]
MRQYLEGSHAVAEIVRLCKAQVISAYPITPQTHIVESLAQMVADGELNAEFINVESEHSAASVVQGASATGVRTYTATTSQGLLYMIEVLYSIAGLRLPVVLTCANRAVSSPINIWNDHQDSVTVRDAGWLQFYAENNQEACDLHLMAYRLAEDHNIMLPVMVCMDGYILTHAYEVVDLPEQSQVDKFLPDFKPVHCLNPDEPISMGVLMGPESYAETRYAIHQTMMDALKAIPGIADDFERVFGRKVNCLIEKYRLEDATQVFVAMGSMVGTIKEMVDGLREDGQKVGLLKIIAHRPFPKKIVYEALKSAREIAVLEKAISLGQEGPLLSDVKSAFCGHGNQPKISGFVLGLGGRDITKKSILEVHGALAGSQVDVKFIDLKI